MRIEKAVSRLFLLLAVVVVLIGCGCSDRQATYPQRQVPDNLMANPAEQAAGKALFMDKCASCHGKPSEGRSDRASFFQPPAPDLTDPHYLEIDPAYLYWRVEVGKTVEPYLSQGSVMPAWEAHFTEKQIWQIVAYLQIRAH